MGKKALKTGVVIAAGGVGTRFGGRIPKQFALLNGKTVLQRTLERFEAVPEVGQIVLVAPAEHLPRAKAIVFRAGLRKVSRIVVGGKDRQDSVWSGLRAFPSPPDVVLVHDAVRPLVTSRLIKEVIRQAIQYEAVVPGVPVRDTVKLERAKGVLAHTLDRSKLWSVQTPQGFRYDLLLQAHRLAKRKHFRATDDASLVELLGVPIRVVEGSHRNMKITLQDDIKIAALWAK